MEKLREYRKRAGMSMDALAKAVGVSMHSIFRWETGKTSPTAKEVVLLSDVLNVPTNELLGVEAQKGEAVK